MSELIVEVTQSRRRNADAGVVRRAAEPAASYVPSMLPGDPESMSGPCFGRSRSHFSPAGPEVDGPRRTRRPLRSRPVLGHGVPPRTRLSSTGFLEDKG